MDYTWEEIKNSLNLAPILQGLPKCRQIVTGNTHDNKCIDVLITNLHSLYQVPVVVAAIQPDNPRQAKPSDHLVPVAYPISGESGSVTRQYQVKTVRPLPESGIRMFGQWLASEDWLEMSNLGSPNVKVQHFNHLMQTKMNTFFPEKSVKMSSQDLPFINWKLKKMKRGLLRLYRKEGRRQEYEILRTEYQTEFQKAARDFVKRNVSELKETNPAKAASILKKLGGAPGDCGDQGQFTILFHQEQNLSPEESTAKILRYFTDISKEYSPLDISTLPVRVKVKLLDRAISVPEIEDYQVYNVIKSAKKPRSAGVSGDLPKKLVQEFPIELTKPMGIIFRSIMEHNKWPSP